MGDAKTAGSEEITSAAGQQDGQGTLWVREGPCKGFAKSGLLSHWVNALLCSHVELPAPLRYTQSSPEGLRESASHVNQARIQIASTAGNVEGLISALKIPNLRKDSAQTLLFYFNNNFAIAFERTNILPATGNEGMQ